MGKKRKSSKSGLTERSRLNPLTGKVELIAGTKAGKKRIRTTAEDPLRTHDILGESKRKK
jgi:hypothetical protein